MKREYSPEARAAKGLHGDIRLVVLEVPLRVEHLYVSALI